jgi:hypothetical protein
MTREEHSLGGLAGWRLSSPTATRRAAIAASAAAAVVLCGAGPARADDTIRHPGDHPSYAVEIEPHLVLGWEGVYGNDGFGAGARFSIPIVHNGFVSSINNSVAISFGADLVHSEWCWYGNNNAGCSANYLDFPVAMQWNFFVAQRWSVFGEPGLLLYHRFLNDCPNGNNCPGHPTVTGLEPAIFLGGRYHFSDGVSLTMRIGFPTFSIGVSFFP